MSNVHDITTVELFVNGEQAKDTMQRLAKEAADLKTSFDKASAAGDMRGMKKCERQLGRVNEQINLTNTAAKGTGIVLHNLANTSLTGLNNALKYLQKELKATRPNTEEWHLYAEKIRAVKKRIKELNAELEGTNTIWDKFKDWSVKAWPAIDLIVRGYQQAISFLREFVDAYASMDQEMANVRKFTGMTADQVADLNKEFKEIDTRTSREELNKLAQEAGRLGKSSKEEVIGFVRAADQINVALDDLGEGATLTLSKLTGVFGDEAKYGTEQSLLKVGSVINELSQNCSASAPYLAEFASRLGGVGAQANMTIPQIMAFGAVLDSNGQKVEASATALSQVIVRMMQDPAKYAKVAGLDVKNFADMLKTDVNGALILFLETLQKSGGMDTLSPMFKDMGENGSRAIAALSTLATQIDDVKAQQVEANKAFREGTSVSEEFAVQNSTVQAELEKAKNKMHDMRVELGGYLAPLMSHMISTSSALVRALVTLIRFVLENKVAIISLTAGIAAYTIVVQKAAIKTATLSAAQKAQTAIQYAYRVAVLAVSTVMSLLSGNVTRATAAFKLFTTAIKANPLGLLVGLITTAAFAIGGWIKKVHDARKAEMELARQRADQAREFRNQVSDISKTAGDYAKSELDNLKKLYSATQDHNKSLAQRYAAARELQKTYPTAFSNLTQEQILVGAAAAAYNELADSIRKAARAKAAQEKITENEKQLLDLEMEREALEESITNNSAALEQAEFRSWEVRKEVAKRSKLKRGPSKADRKLLDNATSAVQILNDNLDKSSERLEEVLMQTGELNKANEALAKKAEYVSKYSKDIQLTKTPAATVPTGTGYESQAAAAKSQKEAEKNARKAAMQQRRELAMAKKAFKDAMNDAKGDWEAGNAENIMSYGSGSKTYEDYLAEKERLDLAYIDRRIEIYNSLYEGESDADKQLLLAYDENYQQFLLKRAELTAKHQSDAAKRDVKEYTQEYKKAVAEKEFEFNSPVHQSYGDAKAQEEELFRMRIDYLIKCRDAYKSNTKEYLDYQRQIDEAEQQRIVDKRKSLMQSYEQWADQYTALSAKRRNDIELKILEELYEKKKISAEQYELWLAQLREKYRSESAAAEKAAEESRSTVSAFGQKIDIRPESEQISKRVDSLQTDKAAAIGELDKRLEGGLISQEEYDNGLKRIKDSFQKNLFDPVREGLDDQTRMLLDLGLSWADFFRDIAENGEISFDNIKEIAKATVASLCAGLQMYSQFLEAQKTIDLANVEKQYDREVELAQGNSYKVAKAEKKKEEETQKIKAEYARKEFQVKVIMAIAQTAENAILGFAAGLQAGFPMAIWLAPLLAGLATAQGAVQIALLKKQQQAAAAQGYSKGGFTKPGAVDEPAGVVHAGEWVASQKLLANPVARPMIDALDHAQRTNTIGSLREEDVSRSITANNSLVRIAESDEGPAVLAAAAMRMSKTVSDLNTRLKEPFVTVNTVTGDKGIKQAQDEYSRLMNNITPKSKRK